MPVLEGPSGQAYYIANPTADDIIAHGYVQCIPDEAEQAFAAAFEHYEREGVEDMMMDFGGAIAGVKAGHKVYREAWAQEAPGKHVRLDGIDKVVVAIEGSVMAYIPSSSDLLAEDWRPYNTELGGDASAGDPVARATYSGQDGPTVPKETIENGNAEFVDTASAGAVPVAPREDDGHEVAGIRMPSVSGSYSRARVDGDDDPTGS